MIRITHTTKNNRTKIEHVKYDLISSADAGADADARHEFDIGQKSEHVYLLVCTNEKYDDFGILLECVEHVIMVSYDFTKIVHSLMKQERDFDIYEQKDYDIKSYKLQGLDTDEYVLDRSFYINRDKYECDDTDYIFVWLCDDTGLVPFPDESIEHFKNKQKECELIRVKSEQHQRTVKEKCDLIKTEMNEQIKRELQEKKDLLRRLNDICDLDGMKYKYVCELDNALTPSQKLLNGHLAEIEARIVKKKIEIVLDDPNIQ